MKVMLTPDEEVAKVWDDYLHRFGAQEYVTARYLTQPTSVPKSRRTVRSVQGRGSIPTRGR